MHRIDLTAGTVLERDCVYIVPLLEMTALPRRTTAAANPKSSTGRLDVFARIITDYGTEFDRVRDGYKGPLYAEISPRSFSVVVRTGSRLVQLRLRRGSPLFRDTALRRLHAESPLVELPEDGAPASQAIRNGLVFTVDVVGQPDTGLIGYKARRHTDVIDVDRVDAYDPNDFWEPVYARRGPNDPSGLVLDPNDFYILASREAVVVPPDHAAEMLPYDTFVGEFRVHYAGFFDPGFGATAEASGAGQPRRPAGCARTVAVPRRTRSGYGPPRGRTSLIARPDRLYGGGIGSSYQNQGLALSKHFKKVPVG